MNLQAQLGRDAATLLKPQNVCDLAQGTLTAIQEWGEGGTGLTARISPVPNEILPRNFRTL